MPVGALIGAAGSIGGALIGSSAAKGAAKTQANAANRAADMNMAMFQTIRGDLTPYRQFGGGALPGLAALLGYGGQPQTFLPSSSYTGAKVPGGNAGTSPLEGAFTGGGLAGTPDWAAYLKGNPDVAAQAQHGVASGAIGPNGQWQTPEQWAAYHYQNTGQAEGRQVPMGAGAAGGTGGMGGAGGIQAFLESLPGYQFTRDQGMQGVTNALSRKGLTGISGAYGKGIARFVTGLADQTYGEQINRLMGAAAMGQNAAVQTGTAGQNATTGATSALIGGANATAAGQVGSANAISGGLQGVGNAYLTSRLLGQYGGLGGGGAPSFANTPYPGSIASDYGGLI